MRRCSLSSLLIFGRCQDPLLVFSIAFLVVILARHDGTCVGAIAIAVQDAICQRVVPGVPLGVHLFGWFDTIPYGGTYHSRIPIYGYESAHWLDDAVATIRTIEI